MTYATYFFLGCFVGALTREVLAAIIVVRAAQAAVPTIDVTSIERAAKEVG